MIEKINDLPSNVIGFRASGKVTKKDYESVLVPGVEQKVNHANKINYLFVLDTELGDVEMGAWLTDFKLSLTHLTNWRKIAIVSDHSTFNNVAETMGHVMPSEVRSFKMSELANAKIWVSH